MRELDLNFAAVVITKTRIQKIDLSYKYGTAHHSIEYTPTESSVGGSLLQKSLPKNINLPKKFESAFIEVIMPKSSNLTTGCIYKHPTFMINEFTNDIIPPLFQKLQKELSKNISHG